MSGETAKSVFIIAEAGVNHNGSLDMAMRLADAAKQAGADAVKYQTFRAEAVISARARKAAYQEKSTGADESQLEMVRKLELSFAEHKRLRDHCAGIGIQYLSTPFDLESADFLIDDLNLPLIKLPSGEITNAPLLLRVARSGKPVILSTGMSTLGDIEEALGVLAFGYLGKDAPRRAAFRAAWASEEGRAALAGKVTLLHCTTEYPAPFADAHLPVMGLLERAFGLPAGFSDHTPGIAAPIAAAALGAKVIEKHFTLDKTLPGPDHAASLEPDELARLCADARTAWSALGEVSYARKDSEKDNAQFRRSLYAARDIKAGEPLTPENVRSIRPGFGLPPRDYDKVLGRRAIRDIPRGTPLDWKLIETGK
jgi:N-acetylneuraminate synthase